MVSSLSNQMVSSQSHFKLVSQHYLKLLITTIPEKQNCSSLDFWHPTHSWKFTLLIGYFSASIF
jgi:hypothetical protein